VDTLDHLPLAAVFGHQLKPIETIDELRPPHPDCAVTRGQCIVAMGLSILAGHYPLYEVAYWLKGIGRDILKISLLAKTNTSVKRHPDGSTSKKPGFEWRRPLEYHERRVTAVDLAPRVMGWVCASPITHSATCYLTTAAQQNRLLDKS